jgi:branched-chain amino acid transport system substrate-binding protein
MACKHLQTLAGCAVALSLGFTTAASADETVKIGMVLSLSGPTASLGENILHGAQLYFDTHKSELPKGVNVELLQRDTGGPNPGNARRLAQELIVRDHVQMIGGLVFTPNAAAIAPLATQSKTPLVLMNASTSKLTRLSPYIVRVSYTQWQTAYTIGEWAGKHGFKKAYVAVSDYAPGIDSEKAFIAAFAKDGRQVIGTVHMPQITPDYVPYMQQIKNAKPDSMFMFTNAGRITTAAVKGYSDAGLKSAGITLLGPGDITSDEELPNMGDAVLGTVTAGIYSAHSSLPQNVKFVKLWKAKYGADSTPSFMAVCGWDGMAAIFAAIKEGKYTGDAAIEVLKHWKNPDSPRGPIAIDPETRDIVQQVYINKVEKVDGHLANVTIETIPNVKDQWKLVNPK